MGTLRSRRLYAALGGVPLALAASCADEDARPPIVYVGEHVRFGTDEDASLLCAGTLSYTDGLVGYLGSVFGIAEPHVDVYWVPDRVGEHCEVERGGCATGHAAFSEWPLHQHELVHAVRGADHPAYLAFEEGLAEAFGDDWDPFFALGGDVGELWAEHGDSPPARLYPLAGYFVSYLGSAYGRGTLVDFDAASEANDDWKKTQVNFSRVFDVGFEDAVAESELEYPRCQQTHYRDNGFDCAADPVLASGEVVLSTSLDCDDEAVLGPRRGERWTSVALKVPESASYLIHPQKSGGLGDGRIALRRCGQDCSGLYDSSLIHGYDFSPSSDDELPVGGYSLSLCLPAGRYVVRFALDEADEAELSLALRYDGPQDC